MAKKHKIPANAQIFLDHLIIGLEAFGLDWSDFLPHTCVSNIDGSVGVLFSQIQVYEGEAEDAAKNSIIATSTGLEFTNQQFMPFTNEQPPSKIAMLVLSAMVRQDPLDPQCPTCNQEASS